MQSIEKRSDNIKEIILEIFKTESFFSVKLKDEVFMRQAFIETGSILDGIYENVNCLYDNKKNCKSFIEKYNKEILSSFIHATNYKVDKIIEYSNEISFKTIIESLLKKENIEYEYLVPYLEETSLKLKLNEKFNDVIDEIINSIKTINFNTEISVLDNNEILIEFKNIRTKTWVYISDSLTENEISQIKDLFRNKILICKNFLYSKKNVKEDVTFEINKLLTLRNENSDISNKNTNQISLFN